MKEAVLRQYFADECSAADLARDLVGTVTVSGPRDGPVVRRFRVAPMSTSFALAPAHVVKLVDAITAGELTLNDLDAIAFALEASDTFEWDTDTPEGERVAKALFWLGTPEVNYPLTPVVLAKIRHYLLTGDNTLTREDLRGKTGPYDVTNIWDPDPAV